MPLPRFNRAETAIFGHADPTIVFVSGFKMFGRMFRGRWVSQILFAVFFLFVAANSFDHFQTIESGKADALSAGMPAPVSLAAFQGWSDIHPADEVHVEAKIFPALNYQLRLTHEGKLSDRVEQRALFFLFAPDADPQEKVVRAALLVDEAYQDLWAVEEFAAGLVSAAEGEFVVRLNGRVETDPQLLSMAEDALRERGLTKSPEFFYLESWGATGRAAALQPDPVLGYGISGVALLIGLIFSLSAVLRFRRRNRQISQDMSTAQAFAGHTALVSKPRRRVGRLIFAGLGLLVAASVLLAQFGVLDDAMFALPVLIILLVILGMRQVAKAVGSAIAGLRGKLAGSTDPMPTPDLPTPARSMPFGFAMHGAGNATALGMIQNAQPKSHFRKMPTLTVQSVPPGAKKWLPLAVGVVLMWVSARMFDGATFGAASLISGSGAPFALPSLSLGSASPLIIGSVAASGLGVMLFTLAQTKRMRSRRDNAADPWARLDRMAAVERARG